MSAKLHACTTGNKYQSMELIRKKRIKTENSNFDMWFFKSLYPKAEIKHCIKNKPIDS